MIETNAAGVMGLGIPLLDDAQADGAGGYLAAKIHITIEIAGAGIMQRVGRIIMPEMLVIGRDIFPAFGGGDVYRRTFRAGEDIHLGGFAIDFLYGEAAHALGLLPFEGIDGGIGDTQWLGALGIPSTIGRDFAAADADGGRGGDVFKTATEHFQALELTPPRGIGAAVGTKFLGGGEVHLVEGGRAFFVVDVGE